jgi:hypothetical protein
MEEEDPGNLPGPEMPPEMTNFNGARPKQYSNVIVDDSPLQNQMEKNKECKFCDAC